MDHAKKLSQQLLALRKAKGLTQEALANQLGITSQAISKWENEQKCPDIALLPRLAEIYDISIGELFGEDAPAIVSAPLIPGNQAVQKAAPRGRSIMALLLAGVLLVMPLVLLFSGVFLAGMSRNPGKSFFGYRYYGVLTGSMHPAIKQGDMIIVKLCAPEAVEVGDVIAFSPANDVVITHRVTQIMTKPNDESLWFITKGDANATEDFPVSANRLIGKMTGRLPGIGRIMTMSGHLSWVLLAGLLLLLTMFCWGLAAVIFALARRKQRKLKAMSL